MKDVLTIVVAVLAGSFYFGIMAVWMAILPTIGLLWLSGFLK